MQVIIPCGGRSSRYPTSRPKYLLTMPDGRPMFMHAADHYYTKFPLTFIVIKEHCEKYDADYAIDKAYNGKVNIVILDEFTSGPAETIYKVIKDWEDTPFLSKDCDGFFNHIIPHNNNFIATIKLQEYPLLTNVAAKSFAITEDSLLKNIIEKQVVSNHICAGAYGFDSSRRYVNNFEIISKNITDEIFISHVIKYDIDTNNVIFKTVNADNYIDCGTYEEFVRYLKQQSTIFSDIDGTVFKNQSQFFKNNYENKPTPNINAVNFLLDKQNNGATIIFTTSRPDKYSLITETALNDIGFKNYRVIYNLPHSPRILINDVSSTNPWPSASAINVPRDDDNFWKTMY